ncbi:transcriptional regulator [Aquimarina atlantica]|uniref:Transcriptional regulator n=1 Tax=Aquimarina atlantica TaxID=1317122 RepID=A0A023BWR9_9FLAO|nr:helix-turn-helix domain-containing protein [Aquimarina atlantica]EZH74063.1 transcriptional regulator [Aquimarina atlantica]
MQTLLNQLVYFGYFQSLFLLCIYLFSPKNRKNINGYVAFLVLVLMIGLSGRVLYISDIFGKNFRLIAFSEFATLLFGSTIYLFTKSSLLNKRFSYQDLLHYLPGVFYIIFVVFIFMLPTDEVIGARIKSGELFRTITIFIGIGLLFNITYWIMSLHLFLSFRKELRNELSYTVKTQFFLNFLIAIGICLLSWVIVYFISIFGFEMIERKARETIWLSIALIILFIAYYGMISPDLFKIVPAQVQKKYAQSKLSKSDLDQLQAKLDRLMIEKKPYLNRKLLKAELADMLGVSSPEIARLLNENIGMNFFEYINYHRIKEFVELAQTDKAKNLTFFGLAQEAGFNSKTTFNKSFKKLMGTSPKEYFTSQQ